MTTDTKYRLDLVFAEGTLPNFARLFSKGVVLEAELGCSIEAFLCRQLGIADSVLEQRIQTIFLNGKPVDDYRNTPITDGDTLALSAAMPGLVGATLRRGGFYAAMRDAITHRQGAAKTCAAKGQITIKLFNLLVPEIGPLLLQYGVRMDIALLRETLSYYENSFARGCQQIILNGEAVSVEALHRISDQAAMLWLTIVEQSASA